MSDIGSHRTKPNYWVLLFASLSAVVLFWQWRTLRTTDIWMQPFLVPLVAMAMLLSAGALAWIFWKILLFQRVVVDDAGVEFVDLLGNQKIYVSFHNIKLIWFHESNQGKAGRFHIVTITVATEDRKTDSKRYDLIFMGATQITLLTEYLLAQVSETWNSTVSVDSTRLSNPNFTQTVSVERGGYPRHLIYWIYDILFVGFVLLPLWIWR